MSLDKSLGGAIAVTRFGLGARPGEIGLARADPQGFLLRQIQLAGADQPAGATTAASDTARRVESVLAYRREVEADRRAGAGDGEAVKAAAQGLRDEAAADFAARLSLAVATDAGFRERWTLFWANHFTVAAIKLAIAPLVGPFEAQAIRPHVFGRFEDLLIAASSNPAMLTYLDQVASIGPDSPAAANIALAGQHRGLNENLAREILELHTVGVDGGYGQVDVTEFARALTGWSVASDRDPGARRGGFLFRPRAHEPGARTIMGRRYTEGGRDQALAVMKTLAASPHTARHVAAKLARHFVADDPPPEITRRLERAYIASGGELSEVARALVTAPQAWEAAALKFKTPYEFLVSSWRATGVRTFDPKSAAAALASMGQKPFSAPSPRGWPDEAQIWCSPDGLIKRMAWSEAFAAGSAGQVDPLSVARDALGARLSPTSARTIARAETRPEALAILVMSPEFQRR